MPAGNRESTSSLIRFASDIGEIRQGVKGLEEGQRRVDKKITGLQRNVADLVTKADCSAHRDEVTERIDTALFAREERGEIPAASPPAMLEAAGRKAGEITAILTLVAMLVGGVVVIARFVSSLEMAIDKDRRVQENTNRQILDELKRARYRPAAIAPQPDAGISAAGRQPRRSRKGVQ